MLLELAIGDAYGAGFEYVNTGLVRHFNDLSGYIHHPRHKAIKPGMYTDDAQMSIAIAEMVITDLSQTEAWTEENLAKRFVRAFKRDPRTGYASGFYGFLLKIEDGTQFLAEIRPTATNPARRCGLVRLVCTQPLQSSSKNAQCKPPSPTIPKMASMPLALPP